MKLLITLEPHGIFDQFCILIHFNIVETLVCKTVIARPEGVHVINYVSPSVRLSMVI